MKKFLFAVALTSALFACALTASAVAYSDVIGFVDEEGAGLYLPKNSTTGSLFDLVEPGSDSFPGIGADAGGYVPGTPLTDAAIKFWLIDQPQDGRIEQFTIALSTADLDVVLDITQQIPGTGITLEFIADQTLREAIEGAGQLSFTISNPPRNTGNWDFTLLYAMLEVNTANGQTVPDGGATAALMGLGLLGIAAARRVFRRS